MAMMHPFASLDELAAGLRSGACSAVDLARHYLDRIVRSQPKLAAFATVDADGALAAAAAADARRRQRQVLGPLDGIPVAVKDMFDTAGQPGACGSAAWAARRAERTSAVVERLQRAGACIVGKTRMVEFAFGAWGLNPRLGTPWNPWDLATQRIPGGSSSGSAVAVAAGLVPVAIGSDTGGSVRTPAALNGVTGLKATRGAVDLAGALPLSAALDSVGVFARTAADTLTVFAALADRPVAIDASAPASAAGPGAVIEGATCPAMPIAGTTIAVLDETAFGGPVDADVVAAYQAAQATFAAGGARLVRRAWPFDVAEIIAAAGVVMAVDGWHLHGAIAADPAAPLGDAVRARLLAGRDIDPATYQAALARHAALARSWPAWLGEAAALLTPSLPIVACPVADADERSTALALFARAGNFVGACGAALPAGFSATGLPIGVQLLARGGDEARLVRLADAFQQRTSFHRRTPDLAALGL
ncbi:MAG: amidase [Lautropia sp.]